MVRMRIIGLVAISFAVCAMLSGCSGGQHQIIGAGESCTSCHSTEHEEFDVSDPSGAVAVASTVSVSTESDSVHVCRPAYTSQDGSSYVPVEDHTVKAVDGIATVNLGEGVWVLALDNGDTSVSKLVVVSGDGGETSIEL